MNGVAFCLVGIPPRPEPRPPQVRAQDPGHAGAGPGATSGLGSLRRRRWAPLRELGVPLGSGRRDSCVRLGLEEGRRAGAPTGQGLPGRGHPVGGGARPWAAGQRGWEARAPFVRDFQAGRPPPFPLPEFSFSVGEAPAQLEPQGVGEGSWGGTSSAGPLRLRLRCGLLGSGLGPQPCPALPFARSGCGWVRERGARGITQRWAALLGFFHLPAAEAGEGPSPSQQGQSPALESGCRFCAFTPTLLLQLAVAVQTEGLNTAWSVVFLNLEKTSLGSSLRVKARTELHLPLTLQRAPVLGVLVPRACTLQTL